MVHTWRKQSIISPLKSDKEKSITCTNKEEVEGNFNLTKPGTNNMHTFFYSDLSEFAGNLEGILDENNEVWFKTKKDIWRGRVLLITYSEKKRIVNI